MPEMSAEMDGKNRLEEGENRMKCPKCGQEAVGNFCSNCGTPLVNDTVRREQETVGRKQENSYDDGDSEQRNPAWMESDEKRQDRLWLKLKQSGKAEQPESGRTEARGRAPRE